MTSNKLIIGAIEECELPDLSIPVLHMRVDTGAQTSSLHVDGIKQFHRNGKPWVKFNIHPTVHQVDDLITCEAVVKNIRRIKSSNGSVDERYIIKTTLKLGQHAWPIHVSLSDRSDMTYMMLLGREGMGDRVLVDPSESYLISSDLQTGGEQKD